MSERIASSRGERRQGGWRRPAVPLGVCAVLACCLLALLASLGAAAGGADQQAPDLTALERAFEHVVQRVAPSVVGLRVERRYVAALPGVDEDGAIGSLEQIVTVNGSGTIVRDDGSILTNEHVIQSASRIEVLFHDGATEIAAVIAADPRSDLAILRTARHDLPPARFCNWPEVRRGHWSLAIGNPFGLGQDGQMSVSVGVVSNLGRRLPGLGEVDDRLYTDLIQTTAAINPGNSGGPLFDAQGALIGVVTAMHTRAAADEGIGFAIPMSAARRDVIQHLLAGDGIVHGYIGVSVRSPTQTERESARLEHPVGAAVLEVDAGGPADLAGLRPGDLILRFNEIEVLNPAHLAGLVGRAPVGGHTPVKLWRDGRADEVDLSVIEREVSRVSWMRGGAVLWRGLRLANLTPAARQRLGADGSATGLVVVDVVTNSPARRARIEIGDVIEKVGGLPVADTQEFRERVATAADVVSLYIRGKGIRAVAP